MKLGKTIKKIRSSRHMTQLELATKAGITQAYLSLIEGEKKQPNMDVLSDISKAIGLSVPFLIFYSIGDEDVPKEKKEIYKVLHPHMKQMVDELMKKEK